MCNQTLQDALALLRPGDTIATAAYFHEPQAFLSRLHLAAAEVEDLSIWTANVMGDYPIMGAECDKIHWLSSFYDRKARAAHPKKQVTYYPSDLHVTGAMMVEAKRPTVFVAAVPPMDPDGTYCVSTSLQWESECAAAADRIILEVNPAIPHADSSLRIPRERVTCAYEVHDPLLVLRYTGEITPEEAAIGGYVSELIHDGDCVQFGLGGTPSAVAAALTDKHDLGIHTEMLGNAMINLIRSGAVTNRRKTLHPGKTVCAFFLGDEDAVDFLENTPDVMFRPAAYTNHPATIARNENMVSVNTTLQVDLLGQVSSESIGSRQYSGTGGAMDFAYGAHNAPNGRSIIAVNATAKGGSLSRISAALPVGSAVSIPRNIVDYVVTEFGIARLRNCSVRQRVENLIAVAHPDFRAELAREAQKLLLW